MGKLKVSHLNASDQRIGWFSAAHDDHPHREGVLSDPSAERRGVLLSLDKGSFVTFFSITEMGL